MSQKYRSNEQLQNEGEDPRQILEEGVPPKSATLDGLLHDNSVVAKTLAKCRFDETSRLIEEECSVAVISKKHHILQKMCFRLLDGA